MTGKFARARERYSLPAFLLLAFAIQFYRLGARTLHGDELTSIVEAEHLGQNLNGILYFALLRSWMLGGTSEFWLRALSALFTVCAVAVGYALAKTLLDRQTGLAMAMLVATAPFVIEYSQQIRFYSLFLLTATLTFLSLILCLRHPSGRRLVQLIAINLALVGTHFFALLVILIEMLVVFVGTPRFASRTKIAFLGVITLICLSLVIFEPARSAGYYLVSVITNPYGNPIYTVSRGISVASVAKIPLTFFFFIFGESVYPLTYALVIPGALIFGAALLVGLVHLRSNHRAFWFILITGALALSLVYLVFDPLAPPTLQGAAPRYLIFLLPIFYLTAAAGAQSRTRWLIIPLLLVNTASLKLYWQGDWAYTDDLIDWRAVTQWVSGYVTPTALVLPDGRAQDDADYYFPPTWTIENSWAYQNGNGLGHLTDYTRLIILSDDFHLDKRASMSTFLQHVAERYSQTAVWSQYPLFIYVYDRREEGADTGRLDLAAEIYGLEFQDVRLPLTANVAGRTLSITGAFGLPALDQQMTRTLPLTQPTRARQIWLLSNVTGASIKTGAVIANLRVTADDGATQTIPLRAGFETSAWNAACQPSACAQAFTWWKRFALLGAERYPEAWQEFDASIFSVALNLNAPTTIRSLEFGRDTAEGVFYVWGIDLVP